MRIDFSVKPFTCAQRSVLQTQNNNMEEHIRYCFQLIFIANIILFINSFVYTQKCFGLPQKQSKPLRINKEKIIALFKKFFFLNFEFSIEKNADDIYKLKINGINNLPIGTKIIFEFKNMIDNSIQIAYIINGKNFKYEKILYRTFLPALYIGQISIEYDNQSLKIKKMLKKYKMKLPYVITNFYVLNDSEYTKQKRIFYHNLKKIIMKFKQNTAEFKKISEQLDALISKFRNSIYINELVEREAKDFLSYVRLLNYDGSNYGILSTVIQKKKRALLRIINLEIKTKGIDYFEHLVFAIRNFINMFFYFCAEKYETKYIIENMRKILKQFYKDWNIYRKYFQRFSKKIALSMNDVKVILKNLMEIFANFFADIIIPGSILQVYKDLNTFMTNTYYLYLNYIGK